MTSLQQSAPVTVIVLTKNEERNLEACLASVSGWAGHLIVVDSGSTDATLAIAKRYGAAIVTRAFDSHAQQWAWALANPEIHTPWVLGLDADQRVTPALRDSILAALDRPEDPDAPTGYFLNRRQIFRGRWIRYGGYYPKYLLKLFRTGAAIVDPADLVDHHFRVSGPTARLAGDLIEDNRNEADITAWIDKHTRYAARQARQEYREARVGDGPGRASVFGDPDARTRWQKRRWRRLPLFVRPALYFVYRYGLRLGFLDGREGFVFHFLQGFWYRLLVDINLDQLRRGVGPDAAPGAPAPVKIGARRHAHDLRT